MWIRHTAAGVCEEKRQETHDLQVTYKDFLAMDINPEDTVLIYPVGINYSDLWMQNVLTDQKKKMYFCIKAAPKEAKSANYKLLLSS